jgi:hypothetical protein
MYICRTYAVHMLYIQIHIISSILYPKINANARQYQHLVIPPSVYVILRTPTLSSATPTQLAFFPSPCCELLDSALDLAILASQARTESLSLCCVTRPGLGPWAFLCSGSKPRQWFFASTTLLFSSSLTLLLPFLDDEDSISSSSLGSPPEKPYFSPLVRGLDPRLRRLGEEID